MKKILIAALLIFALVLCACQKEPPVATVTEEPFYEDTSVNQEDLTDPNELLEQAETFLSYEDKGLVKKKGTYEITLLNTQNDFAAYKDFFPAETAEKIEGLIERNRNGGYTALMEIYSAYSISELSFNSLYRDTEQITALISVSPYEENELAEPPEENHIFLVLSLPAEVRGGMNIVYEIME